MIGIRFSNAWKVRLAWAGVTSVDIPAKSPSSNPHAERFIKSIRHECPDRFIAFGETHLRHLVREYVAHYNAERYYQGIGGKLLAEGARAANNPTGIVKPRSRLGGTSISTTVSQPRSPHDFSDTTGSSPRPR